MFLLDTDTLSQLSKVKPNPLVMTWLNERPLRVLHLSVITLFEIRSGIDELPEGKRRQEFERWLNDNVLKIFHNRILPISQEISLDAGSLFAKTHRGGFNIKSNDTFIAATARIHNLTVATLNRKDFQHLEVPLVDFQSANS